LTVNFAPGFTAFAGQFSQRGAYCHQVGIRGPRLFEQLLATRHLAARHFDPAQRRQPAGPALAKALGDLLIGGRLLLALLGAVLQFLGVPGFLHARHGLLGVAFGIPRPLAIDNELRLYWNFA